MIDRAVPSTIETAPVSRKAEDCTKAQFEIEMESDERHAATVKEAVDIAIFHFGGIAGDSLANFIQHTGVLISSASQVITTITMETLDSLFLWCSTNQKLALVQADLFAQLMISLYPQSLSFDKAVNIHIYLMKTITRSFWLTTLDGLAKLKIEGQDGQQAVHETVLKQILSPSEKYICHLCVNRFSIIDGTQSLHFLGLLAKIIRISPYYQPTMNFVLYLPTPSMVATLSFILLRRHSRTAALFALLVCGRGWNHRSIDGLMDGDDWWEYGLHQPQRHSHADLHLTQHLHALDNCSERDCVRDTDKHAHFTQLALPHIPRIQLIVFQIGVASCAGGPNRVVRARLGERDSWMVDSTSRIVSLTDLVTWMAVLLSSSNW
ncbi:hypothetical protein BLNAU_11174 [Blattamonas nauphoetae]|uniref:Uncharacterized protein n=1 Tax=Blattamonas nauphoetae TaxID=2049346 RepID=A0ABQ9XQ97_9EUKA|nr:hypothetical protein BLNAU_11174 [Blattamonas nauphoetae]